MITNIVFHNDIDISPVHDDSTHWILDSDLKCTLTRDGQPYEITIDKGFITDLATTPRILWPFFPPFGTWDDAATLHDYIYSGYTDFTREEADECLYYGMIAGDTSKFTATIFYWAVHLLASSHWDKD